MTEKEVMEKQVALAARQRKDGDSGQQFIATSMFAIAKVCSVSDFPQEEVQSLAATAIREAYKPEEDDE